MEIEQETIDTRAATREAAASLRVLLRYLRRDTSTNRLCVASVLNVLDTLDAVERQYRMAEDHELARNERAS